MRSLLGFCTLGTLLVVSPASGALLSGTGHVQAGITLAPRITAALGLEERDDGPAVCGYFNGDASEKHSFLSFLFFLITVSSTSLVLSMSTKIPVLQKLKNETSDTNTLILILMLILTNLILYADSPLTCHSTSTFSSTGTNWGCCDMQYCWAPEICEPEGAPYCGGVDPPACLYSQIQLW